MSSSLIIILSMSFSMFIGLAAALYLFFKYKKKKKKGKKKNNKNSGGGSSSSSSQSPGKKNGKEIVFADDAFKPNPSGTVSQNQTLGNCILTQFTFENNTPCCSTSSASGKPLIPFVSCSLMFRYLKDKKGGPLKMGDQIYCAALAGRKMPNGKTHSGWLRIVTYCGDLGNDAYCAQSKDGKMYPLVDVYVGSFPASGSVCDGQGSVTGYVGDGNLMSEVKAGPAPAGDPAATDGKKGDAPYGGQAFGTCKCSDCVQGCVDQTKQSREACLAEIKLGQAREAKGEFSDKCWWYTPQYDSEAQSWCNADNSIPGGTVANGGA